MPSNATFCLLGTFNLQMTLIGSIATIRSVKMLMAAFVNQRL
jgi:hypothetical protein